MILELEKVMNALISVTDRVYHYEAHDAKDRYVVWAEDGEVAALSADTYKIGQTIEGTIDYFTSDEDDEIIEQIPIALNRARIGWRQNSVQYEEETELIHYEWVFFVRKMYGED